MELAPSKIWCPMVRKVFFSNLINTLLLIVVTIIYFRIPNINNIKDVLMMLALYSCYCISILYEMGQYSLFLKEKKIINILNISSILVGLAYMFGGIYFIDRTKLYSVVIVLCVVLINILRIFSVNFFQKGDTLKNKEVNIKLTYKEMGILILEFILMLLDSSNGHMLLICSIFSLLYVTILLDKKHIHFCIVVLLIALSMVNVGGIIKNVVFALGLFPFLKNSRG